MTSGFELENNICEICGEQAISAMIDEYHNNDLRYSCIEHYQQLYEKMKKENGLPKY